MDVDVSDLMTDPDVGGKTFTVIRRPETVDDQGTAHVTEIRHEDIDGAVFPTGDNSMVREDAYSQGMKSMTVVTKFRLRTATKLGGVRYQADLVEVLGDRYIVKTVKDYSPYGAGFIEAECISIDFADAATQIAVPTMMWMDFSDPGNSSLIGAT